MSKYTEDDLREELKTKEYEYGFYTEMESETFPIGLNEDIVRAISKKKNEPEWMTNWRLEAYRIWEAMTEPDWANVTYKKPDFQSIAYYSAPKSVDPNKTLDDVNEANNPLELLLRAHSTLSAINTNSDGFNKDLLELIKDINSICWNFQQTLKHNND